MKVQDIQRLFDYMYWANAEMWQCAQNLTPHQRRMDNTYSVGSVQQQLFHLVAMDNLWINYLWHGDVEFLQPWELPTLDHIIKERDALEHEIRDYLSTLTDADLDKIITPPFMNLPPMHLQDALLQIINHATDHRAQILAAIHRLGGQTIAQDYMRYLAQSPSVAMAS